MGSKWSRCSEWCRQEVWRLCDDRKWANVEVFYSNAFSDIDPATTHLVFCHCSRYPPIPPTVREIALLSCRNTQTIRAHESVEMIHVL
jgi:hypothetical protein